MADPRAGAEDARQWEAVDGALFIRTPEEEASGEWKPPTQAHIDANRARFTAYRAWKASISTGPGRFHESGAFAAGYAAALAHATTAPDPATVSAMREALGKVGDLLALWQDRGIVGAEVNSLRVHIAALLGPAATEGGG